MANIHKFLVSPPILTSTSGRGLWTREKRTVLIERLQVRREPYGMGDYAGVSFFVRAYFKTTGPDGWRVNTHGLIYTDAKWLREFKENLVARGIPKSAVRGMRYTEQGMQGSNYVSLECSWAFWVETAAGLD